MTRADDSRPGPVDVGSEPGHDPYCAAPLVCMCEELAAARADERERREEFWEARWREAAEQREQAWTDLARAETVAARLVEVICEQESEYDVAAQYFRELREYDRNLIRADVEKRVRAQIAADIEAGGATFVADQDSKSDGHTCKTCDLGRENYIRAITIASRIARGDA